ncbi:MAG: Yip1 family protein [Thermodesulfobacteriota bacterium]|nr:Yip1 family protein [Thermodesulfobacteriota bacterium]
MARFDEHNMMSRIPRRRAGKDDKIESDAYLESFFCIALTSGLLLGSSYDLEKPSINDLYKQGEVMSQLTDRMVRAAKLDVNLYEEVEADTSAMGQAMAVVILASLAAGIGSISTSGGAGILIGTLSALAGWFIWAYLTFFIGTKMLPEPQTDSNPGELLRTIGFSSAPGVLRIIGIIPGLYTLVFIISGIWMLIAMIIAVRQALDYQSTGRAIGVCLIGWLVQILVLGLMVSLFVGPTQGTM